MITHEQAYRALSMLEITAGSSKVVLEFTNTVDDYIQQLELTIQQLKDENCWTQSQRNKNDTTS